MSNRSYIRLKDGEVEHCPTNDYDGSVVGRIVFNVAAYFDENPEEARRLGWVKHVTHTSKEIHELVDWDEQTQFLVKSMRQVDEWTVEDEYHVLDKTEEMLLREELDVTGDYYSSGTGIVFFGE